MNKEKIQLPGFLLADLYKQNLVIIDGEQKLAEGKETAERQWFLGSNLQKITLMVNEKEAVYLPDESLQFLSNILGACKLNLGDVAIVNHHNDPVDYSFLKEKLSPKFLILFGVAAKQVRLPFTMPDYQVQQHDNCGFLFAPPLSAMLGDSEKAKLEKSKLWLCLKKMFNI